MSSTVTAPAEVAEASSARAGEELGAMSAKTLESELCHWAAQLAAADSHFLAMIAEFDRRKGWARWGMVSCSQWLSWRCALAPQAARERVRVANAVTALPHTQRAFRSGVLSYSKVRAITRVATVDTESDLLELAMQATAGQLEIIVRAWRKCLEGREPDQAQVHDRARMLHHSWADNGCLVGNFCLSPSEGASLLSAIDLFTAPPPTKAERDVSAETSNVAQRRADALAKLAQIGLGNGQGGNGVLRRGHEQVMTVVEVDATTEAAVGHSDRCRLRNGPAIATDAALRLACDCLEMHVLRDENGDAVGETSPVRTIPRRVRRALQHRDKGHCVFPGCTAHQWTEAHHLVHRARGGSHELHNLATLCRRHHHLVHEGGFGIETDDHGRTFRFQRPDGVAIPRSPTPPPVQAATLGQSLSARGMGWSTETLSTGTGERLDLELTLWALAGNNPDARLASAETRRGRTRLIPPV